MISSSKTQATLLLVLVLGILLASHTHAFLKVGKRRLELLKDNLYLSLFIHGTKFVSFKNA